MILYGSKTWVMPSGIPLYSAKKSFEGPDFFKVIFQKQNKHKNLIAQMLFLNAHKTQTVLLFLLDLLLKKDRSLKSISPGIG